jgi:hypothetical protein
MEERGTMERLEDREAGRRRKCGRRFEIKAGCQRFLSSANLQLARMNHARPCQTNHN